MAWGKNGTPDTLTGTGDILQITDLTANKFNVFLQHSPYDSSWINPQITFNNNTNSVYAGRVSYNGGTDGTYTSRANQILDGSGTADDKFMVNYTASVSGEEKLSIIHYMNRGTAGAGNTPNRTQNVWKFVPSPDADITRIDSSVVGYAGSYDTGSNLSAIGSELTPAAAIPFPTDVQVGSRYEETDTRKMYHRDDITGTDVSLTGLKAYYNFDQTSGNLINQAGLVGSTDSLDSNADGTNSNVSQTNTGKLGNSYLYNATSSYTQLGSSLSQFNFIHQANAKLTLNCWFKMTNISSSNHLFSTYAVSGYRTGTDIVVNSREIYFVTQSSSTGTVVSFQTSGSIIPNNTDWHMVTIRVDDTLSSNQVKIKIDDGVEQSGNTGTGAPSTGNAQHEGHIGSSGAENAWFDGRIDEMSIFNRILTDAEVTTLYNSGAGKRIADDPWKEIGS
jgi:hypothetical protein